MSSSGLHLGPVSGRNYFQCIFSLCRRITCTRRPSRLWFTPFLARHPITLKCGRPPRLPTATSVRVCCGASRGRACAAQSVESNATKNARSFSTQTVYRVSHQPNTEKTSNNKTNLYMYSYFNVHTTITVSCLFNFLAVSLMNVTSVPLRNAFFNESNQLS